eukprot:CAMPEP_0114661938 /NCGR_PEP_ID=MMETSP0191-20121206/23708_1 /TAXON_ID=126664 /ORGANISM="Sorites sp." /LENGTH=56 /DNA_ID=CAMNT_0001896381 /DNA_START=84 /DNA_END=254 /DNA_ORIENTATION=+
MLIIDMYSKSVPNGPFYDIDYNDDDILSGDVSPLSKIFPERFDMDNDDNEYHGIFQ